LSNTLDKRPLWDLKECAKNTVRVPKHKERPYLLPAFSSVWLEPMVMAKALIRSGAEWRRLEKSIYVNILPVMKRKKNSLYSAISKQFITDPNYCYLDSRHVKKNGRKKQTQM
tara:strand:- start:29 stop:367 length:339 start_codon:yes stop_codon:yes gene_type:complete